MTYTPIILISVATTLLTTGLVLAASFYWARSAGFGEHRWSDRGTPHIASHARHGCGEHADARLDRLVPYLEDALNVTAAQQPQWNAFVDAVREGGATLQGLCGDAEQPGTTPQRLARFEGVAQQGLEVLARIRVATTELYRSFTDAQKSRFDDLLAHGGGRHARRI